MNKWASIAISALSDFFITAGGTYSTAALAGGAAVIPNQAAIYAAIALGIVQAFRGVQKTLSPPPQ
jgi:hypothetical protein